MASLTREQRQKWDDDGFVVLRGFAEPAVCESMLLRARDIAREEAAGAEMRCMVMPEPVLAGAPVLPEYKVSKIFRLHRDEEVFRSFCVAGELLDVVAELLAPELDCFLSQFIFKEPGALGQPWHQDSFYFPFDRGPQLGVWLAVTESTAANGPLHVLPGSHREPVHDVIADRRPAAAYGYVEIVDHDTSSSVPVLMQPGDILLFHSHLMHRSTDNLSDQLRAAMVYHYAEAGTVDNTKEQWGFDSPNNDWMPVRRNP